MPAAGSLLLVGEEGDRRADKEPHSFHIGTLNSKESAPFPCQLFKTPITFSMAHIRRGV